MERLDNTLLVITGASTGIGFHVTKQVLDEIDTHNTKNAYQNLPILIAISRRKIENIKNSNFRSKQADLSKPADINNVFEEIKSEFPNKKISVILANAGMARAIPILSDERLLGYCEDDTSFENAAEGFSQMMNLNLLGLTLCVRKAVELMDHNFPGYVINLNSMSGHRVTVGVVTHFYSATKHAVTAITESIRQELRQLKSKIRVGQICPGYVDTEFFEAMNVKNEDYDKKIDQLRGHALQSEDIGNAVMMMIKSDERCQYGDVMIRPTFQAD